MISVSGSALYKTFATARIVAFNAWQSPPLVKNAILLMPAHLRFQSSFFSSKASVISLHDEWNFNKKKNAIKP